MAEVKFVFKSFIVTIAVIFALQFEWNHQSTEQRLTRVLQNSPMHRWLKDMARGGIVLSQQLYHQGVVSYREWMGEPQALHHSQKNNSTESNSAQNSQDQSHPQDY